MHTLTLEEQAVKWRKQLLTEFSKPISITRYNEHRKHHKYLPTTNQLVKTFGGWTQAMSALYGEEINVYRTKWTAEAIESIIKQAIADHADYPSVTAYDKWHKVHPNTPSVRTIERNYGSYQALMQKMGQTNYQGIGKWAKEDIAEKLITYFEDQTRPRTYKGYAKYRKEVDSTLPSPKILERHYGTWRELLTTFGQPIVKSEVPVERLQKKVISSQEEDQARALMLQLSMPITTKAYRALRQQQQTPMDYPSYERLRNHFGSWEIALQQLGFDSDAISESCRKQKPELLSEPLTRQQLLHYFSTMKSPTYKHYTTYAKRKNAKKRQQATMVEIKRYYGGWEHMLHALNVQVQPKAYVIYNESEMIQALQQAFKEVGNPLTLTKYEEARKTRAHWANFPSSRAIYRQFRTWKDALEAAGIEHQVERNLMKRSFDPKHENLTAFLDWCLE